MAEPATITFANPFLACDQCAARVVSVQCVPGPWLNQPCGHAAGSTSVCPSWGPVDGCSCLDHLGYVPHRSVLA